LTNVRKRRRNVEQVPCAKEKRGGENNATSIHHAGHGQGEGNWAGPQWRGKKRKKGDEFQVVADMPKKG